MDLEIVLFFPSFILAFIIFSLCVYGGEVLAVSMGLFGISKYFPMFIMYVVVKQIIKLLDETFNADFE